MNKYRKIIREERRKTKLIKIVVYLSLIIALILFVLVIILSGLLMNYYPYPYKANLIIDSDLIKQTSQIKSIFNQIKPYYLENQGEIRIVKNISSFCLDSNSINCAGLNYHQKHLIIVEYTNNVNFFKTALCHELLHTYVNAPSDEKIVEDLDDTLPCFNSDKQRLIFSIK